MILFLLSGFWKAKRTLRSKETRNYVSFTLDGQLWFAGRSFARKACRRGLSLLKWEPNNQGKIHQRLRQEREKEEIEIEGAGHSRRRKRIFQDQRKPWIRVFLILVELRDKMSSLLCEVWLSKYWERFYQKIKSEEKRKKNNFWLSCTHHIANQNFLFSYNWMLQIDWTV